jgi:hypothetical protein
LVLVPWRCRRALLVHLVRFGDGGAGSRHGFTRQRRRQLGCYLLCVQPRVDLVGRCQQAKFGESQQSRIRDASRPGMPTFELVFDDAK